MIFIVLMVSILVAGAVFYFFVDSLTVKKKIAGGFPKEWEKLLVENVGIYHTLSDDMKKRFKNRIHYFILTTPIYGYQTPIDDKIKILVASSAVMLTLSFEKWNFEYLDEVCIIDGVVSSDSETGGAVTGQVMAIGERSKMTLSKPVLLQGFRNMNDRKNVGVHEFAHILDHADGDMDGIPKAIMPKSIVEQWTHLMKRKIDDIYDDESDINSYGATDESEFFAVATEYFFEKPEIMEKKHPELYSILSKTFQQDNSDSFMINFKMVMGQMKDRIGRNSPCPCGSGKKFKKCCLNE